MKIEEEKTILSTGNLVFFFLQSFGKPFVKNAL